MNEFHNTGWDPHQELLTCSHNIGQLVLAVQNNSALTKDLASKYSHQQEVIQQLMFQNRRLNQLLELHRVEMTQIKELINKTANTPNN